MAAWASLASRVLESPAMESGSISKIGSMPTQMGDFFCSMAARRRSENSSSIGAKMIANASRGGEKSKDRNGEQNRWLGKWSGGAGEIDMNYRIAGKFAGGGEGE